MLIVQNTGRRAVRFDRHCHQHLVLSAAELALSDFRQRWPKHQVVADVWQRNWDRIIPFSAPEEVRKVIYTTNAVESLHANEAMRQFEMIYPGPARSRRAA